MKNAVSLNDISIRNSLLYFYSLTGIQRHRTGEKLMDPFFQFMKEHGYSAAYLWTTKEQETAASLYKKYGFRLVEEKSSEAFGKLLVEQNMNGTSPGAQTYCQYIFPIS